MGLPELMFGNPFGDSRDDRLTAEDIANGRDISDSALFNYAMGAPQEVRSSAPRSHTDNPAFRRRMSADADDSDAGIFRSIFEDDPAPARPYAGPRSQWD